MIDYIMMHIINWYQSNNNSDNYNHNDNYNHSDNYNYNDNS